MWKRHRSKLLLLAIVAGAGAAVYFGYSGPASDRRAIRGWLLAVGAVVVGVILLARVLRCPRCGADLGYFQSLPIMGRLRTLHPRYVSCRYCGCVIDRHRDNRVVEGAVGKRGI